MAEDEGVGPRWLGGRKESAKAVQFLGSDGEANHLFDCGFQSNRKKSIEITLTHDIDGINGAGNAIWIVFDNVSRLENSLDGAGFDIELVIAETVFSGWPFSSAVTNHVACKAHAWGLGRLPFHR